MIRTYLLRRKRARLLTATVNTTTPGQATFTPAGGKAPYKLNGSASMTLVAPAGVRSARITDARGTGKTFKVLIT